MSVPAAYLGVVIIWATTPLAIKWSGEGPGFLFGVAGRMAIGAVLALALAWLTRVAVWRRPRALPVYLAAGLGIYGAMLASYWAAQRIPSGWISVVFGLSPILTGLLAPFCLHAPGLTPLRTVGAGLGLAGLAVIFGRGGSLDGAAPLGIAAVVGAAAVHSASAVCVKRLGRGVPPLAVVSGGLGVAAPLFLLTWGVFDGGWPAELPRRAAASILYLGVVGSVVGFALYYFVLSRVEAAKVALITLVTPVAALLLGHVLNDEPLTGGIWLGAGLVVMGLAVFELGDRLVRRAVPVPQTGDG